MIRNMRALAALVALSGLALSQFACATPMDQADAAESEEATQDIVSRSAHFETFEGIDGQYYFGLIARNGQQVLRSEGYATLASATGGVASVLDHGRDARRFDLRQAKSGEWYFNLVAGNGEVIGTSELYASRSSAERGARTVRALVRLSSPTSQPARRHESFELFRGEDGRQYFHLRAVNGEIVLASQAYTARSSAKDGIASVLENGSDPSRYEIVETADGQYALRLLAANGEIVARGESYASKSNATRAAARLVEILSRDVETTAL